MCVADGDGMLHSARETLPVPSVVRLNRYVRVPYRTHIGLSRRAMDALMAYDFPGNIRELQNLMERGVICAERGGQIDVQHLFIADEVSPVFPQALSREGKVTAKPSRPTTSDPAAIPARISSAGDLATAESALYEDALRRAGGNVSAAARSLGLTRAKLEYRLRKMGLIG